jgi:hypothetical protein
MTTPGENTGAANIWRSKYIGFAGQPGQYGGVVYAPLSLKTQDDRRRILFH